MEEQLQLSDIAMYLPYGLTFLHDGEVKEIEWLSTTSFNIKGKSFAYGAYGDISDIKPALRHISDLSIPAWKNEFLSAQKDKNEDDWIFEAIEGGHEFIEDDYQNITYRGVKFLIENLFDINNLIGRGLAISIHDLPK